MLYEAVNVGEQKAWCGPTVIASITGLTVPAVKARIKQVRGRDGPIKGTSTYEVAETLRRLGYDVRTISNYDWRKVAERPTFAQWLKRTRESRDPGAAYILAVGNHWVVIKGRWFCDTYTKGQPVRITKAPHKRRRVGEAYKVVPR